MSAEDKHRLAPPNRQDGASWASQLLQVDIQHHGSAYFLELLDKRAERTIVGSGRCARLFRDKTVFFEEAYRPIAAHFTSAMKLMVIDGDHVVIRWDGIANLNDGQTCRNSYTWFFTMTSRSVVKAVAPLDLPTYDAALESRPLPKWPIGSSRGEIAR